MKTMANTSMKASGARLNASTMVPGQADGFVTLDGRQEVNRELKEREQREAQRALNAHRKRTGRFLEDDLLIQVWATLKTPEPMNDNEWWDDAVRRFINEVQRRVGFTVGYIRADEARPCRHVHIAIVAHGPVPLRAVEDAWLAIVGPSHGKRVWVERYRPGGGGISYQMKADGQYRCDWQFSPNIDLFRRSGDGKFHRKSTSRERRLARRVLQQRLAINAPRSSSSPTTSDPGSQPGGGVAPPKANRDAVVRLVDPRNGGRLVATYPAGFAA